MRVENRSGPLQLRTVGGAEPHIVLIFSISVRPSALELFSPIHNSFLQSISKASPRPVRRMDSLIDLSDASKALDLSRIRYQLM